MNLENENNLIEEDYYACLNISRDASSEDITSAYRRLSRMYHPDKHTDEELKKKADLLFNRIKKSYEVLSDPHRRAIYDTVGVKGLKTDGWEIVQRTKTPQEIRDEYERLAREKNDRRLQLRTNPKGNVTVHINATDIFTTYEDDYEDFGSLFPNIEVAGMSVSQSIEFPLTLKDTLTFNGNLSTQNGTGSGSFIVSCKRLLESGWVEGEFSAGNGPFATVKYFRTLTKTIFANIAGQCKLTSNGARLGFVTSLGMPLDSHTQGYLTWTMGFSSAMTAMIVRDTDKSHSGVVVSLGVSSSYMSMNHTWKINKADLKLRIYGRVGTVNSVIECSAEKKVSEQSSLSAAVAVGFTSGVVLKIKIIRAHQSYLFPIHLSEEPSLIPSVYAAVTPFVVWFVIKKLVVEPFKKELKEKEIEKQREINKNKMEEKKREAKAAVDLMKASFERIHSEEESRNGLIILRALYGKNADTVAKADDIEANLQYDVIDVTVPLQCQVKDSQLTLHGKSKSQLSGFYDPCVGEDKLLFIQYLYRSHLFETSIKDEEVLRIPKQAHRVSST